MKKRRIFLPAFLIYCFLLILIVCGGLYTLYNVLEAYETSRPDNTVSDFFAQNGREYCINEIKSIISDGFTEFSDRDAELSAFGIDPEGELSWYSAAGGNDQCKYYDVRIGGTTVGRLTVVPDTDLGFGMRKWKVSECTFDPGRDTSVTLSAPTYSTVYINGVAVGEDYRTGSAQAQVELGEAFDIAPQYDVYGVDGIRGPMDIKALDENGEQIEPIRVEKTEIEFAYEPRYSVSFWASKDATVCINGVDISEDFADTAGEKLCGEVKFRYYSFDGLYTEPEVTVTDGGEAVSPVELTLGTCYFPGASASVSEEFAQFADGFIHAYVDFAANKGRAATTNFNALAYYLKPKTELYRVMQETIENIRWAKTSDITYHDTDCYDLIPLSDGSYILYIHYDVSYVFVSNPRDITADYALLFRKQGDRFYVEAMNPEL